MSILDDNIFENTDLVEISNKGFPDTQLLNEYLNHYPHGARDPYRSNNDEYAIFEYINRQWFQMYPKIKEFACKSGIYVVGFSSYTKYNNIHVKDKYFGLGWNNYFEVKLFSDNSYMAHDWTSTLYGEYSTYEEAVRDSYKMMNYIKECPGYAFYMYMYINYHGISGCRNADKLINYIKNRDEFTR